MNASRVVIDASVAVKWFSSEVHSPNAEAVARSYAVLLAPLLILSEVSNALLKKVRRGEAVPAICEQAVRHLETELRFVSGADLFIQAFDIALRYQRSVYDALYVAVALQEGCQLVTADEKLYNGLTSVFPGTMLWVGDVPV